MDPARGRGRTTEPPGPEEASQHPARAPPRPPRSCPSLPGPQWTESQRLARSRGDTVPGPGQVSSRHLPSVGLQGWAVSKRSQAQVQSGFRAWTSSAEWDGVRQDPAYLARLWEDQLYPDQLPRVILSLQVLALECQHPQPTESGSPRSMPLGLKCLCPWPVGSKRQRRPGAGPGASSRPPPTSGGALLRNVPWPSESARREALQTCRPLAACSISAPGLNEIPHPVSPEVSPVGELGGPAAQPGEGCETWTGS